MQQQIYPARERDVIRRAAKKSVAVQTPGLSRVWIILNLYLFKIVTFLSLFSNY